MARHSSFNDVQVAEVGIAACLLNLFLDEIFYSLKNRWEISLFCP
jgi:hypothetical protein